MSRTLRTIAVAVATALTLSACSGAEPTAESENTASARVDKCDNVKGNQRRVPDGMQRTGGLCGSPKKVARFKRERRELKQRLADLYAKESAVQRTHERQFADMLRAVPNVARSAVVINEVCRHGILGANSIGLDGSGYMRYSSDFMERQYEKYQDANAMELPQSLYGEGGAYIRFCTQADTVPEYSSGG